MKSLSALFLAIALFAFVGCSEADKTNTGDAQTEATQTTAPAAQNPTVGPATDNSMPAAAPNTNTQTQPAAVGGDVALNPAHGQPNHRCDIAVGAPLNSAPAQQPQTIQVQ